jgi:hippurate hydrolase
VNDVTIRLRSYQPELVALRRDIHAHPELGQEEIRTAALVADRLRAWGIAAIEGVGGFGVVGTLAGRWPGQRAIGLRADMDALEIVEQTGVPYASVHPGRMHACGHDGHTTMLLGAARYLAENPDFAGTVHFIFQPAEEGRGGARAMLADGLFERFPCDAVYGMHAMPGIAAGRFAIRSGPFMASGCRWQVAFGGTGGHGGASPHLSTDVTVVLGHFLLAVQTVVSRNVSPLDRGVVSVGHVSCGSIGSPSVMPAEAVVAGTARCFVPEVGEVISRRLDELAHTLAAAHGCTAEVSIEWRAPPLVNHAGQVEVAVAAATDVVGADAVDADARPVTAAEDFAEMLAVRPGALLFIGNGTEADGHHHGLHTPHFDFNDEIIPVGAAYWVSVVRQELG